MSEMRSVPGFDRYRIGCDGSVWSCCRGDWVRINPVPDKDGYLRVHLWGDGSKTRRYVHHLVLEAFVGPRPPGLECRHLNGDVKDNRACNLAWGTHSQNIRDCIRHGTHKPHAYRGSASPMAKLTEAHAAAILRLSGCGESAGVVARQFGISPDTVADIWNRRTWKHVAPPAQ